MCMEEENQISFGSQMEDRIRENLFVSLTLKNFSLMRKIKMKMIKKLFLIPYSTDKYIKLLVVVFIQLC